MLPKLSPMELELLGFPTETAVQIKKNYMAAAEAEIKKARKNNVHIIFHEDDLYPSSLREIHEPPDYIYALGNIESLRSKKIAVVGSRKGSPYGRAALKRIIPDLCRGGLVIVSGMAYGIDTMAHQITIRQKGRTIGVNAGGLLHLYPAGNKGLIHQITNHGCVISEFPLDTVPRPFYFPIRNRIISGISQAILVVEAAMKSGSLITARLGLEQNRDIFAIPGKIDSILSEGPNYLIQQGAKLITSSTDILEEYGITLEEDCSDDPELTVKEKKLLELMMDSEIKSVDYLVENLDDSVSGTLACLVGLTLKNLVTKEGTGYRRIR